MSGVFGVALKGDCSKDLFYGTDYHSHLGTMFGGLAVKSGSRYLRAIHDISNSQFRSKLEPELDNMAGSNMGIGVISDHDPQPLIAHSHLGDFSIVTVNKIANLGQVVGIFDTRRELLLERSGNEQNSTELIAGIINKEDGYARGLQLVQETIKGSCSILLLTNEGIYAARDKLGRTPLILGRKENGSGFAVASESSAFPNNGYAIERELGPGEIVLITPEGIEQKSKPNDKMQICSFLWVYYGYPSSDYEAMNVEISRYRCGAKLAKAEKHLLGNELKIDFVAGIPDSGTSHGMGYAEEAGIPFKRPFVKYTPTWPRSFMPQNQEMRKLVARMKLVPIKQLVKDKSLLFCEDSIVRGTQLKDTVKRLFDAGAKEVHMRPACPPLIYGCKFLNFSRAKTENELAGQRAIRALEGIKEDENIAPEILQIYANDSSQQYQNMVEWIRKDLGLTTLKYQKLSDLIEAIGLPKEKLCTHCWDGSSYF